uniref:Uncharacterized protein n=1 Tax=Sphaerodactylus townsendi TaxID=933632 RepID=A0ACB8F3A8_9SAUR
MDLALPPVELLPPASASQESVRRGCQGITSLEIVSKGDWNPVMEGEVPLWLQGHVDVMILPEETQYHGQQLADE